MAEAQLQEIFIFSTHDLASHTDPSKLIHLSTIITLSDSLASSHFLHELINSQLEKLFKVQLQVIYLLYINSAYNFSGNTTLTHFVADGNSILIRIEVTDLTDIWISFIFGIHLVAPTGLDDRSNICLRK
jgi:hypothetical protein